MWHDLFLQIILFQVLEKLFILVFCFLRDFVAEKVYDSVVLEALLMISLSRPHLFPNKSCIYRSASYIDLKLCDLKLVRQC